MPKYVKGEYGGRIVAISPEWENSKPSPFGYDKVVKWGFHACDCKLATEEEYISQNKPTDNVQLARNHAATIENK